MSKKKKETENYLDQIPRITLKNWEVLEDGLVEVTVENKGFFNGIAQKFFHRPKTSYIKLDLYGSCVFQQIDGKKTIYEIGQILGETHKEASDQLYERLASYFETLRRLHYIEFQKRD